MPLVALESNLTLPLPQKEVQSKAYNSLRCAPNLLYIAAPSFDPFEETYELILVVGFESHSSLPFASKGGTTQF